MEKIEFLYELNCTRNLSKVSILNDFWTSCLVFSSFLAIFYSFALVLPSDIARNEGGGREGEFTKSKNKFIPQISL